LAQCRPSWRLLRQAPFSFAALLDENDASELVLDLVLTFMAVTASTVNGDPAQLHLSQYSKDSPAKDL
jgi:hypothetical protein